MRYFLINVYCSLNVSKHFEIIVDVQVTTDAQKEKAILFYKGFHPTMTFFADGNHSKTFVI